VVLGQTSWWGGKRIITWRSEGRDNWGVDCGKKVRKKKTPKKADDIGRANWFRQGIFGGKTFGEGLGRGGRKIARGPRKGVRGNVRGRRPGKGGGKVRGEKPPLTVGKGGIDNWGGKKNRSPVLQPLMTHTDKASNKSLGG